MMERHEFEPEELAALWEGWRVGLTLSDIGRGLQRKACTVMQVIRRKGGYVPRARKRSGRSLRAHEREEISRGLAAGASIREIARRLGRAASSISREVRRNGGRQAYRASQAEARAWDQAQ